MKKLIALILGLAMICSLPTTAFAAGEKTGTTTLTAEVPEASYTYTIHIPADMTLEYGNNDVQKIGAVYVSDVAIPSGKSVGVDISTSNLAKGSSTIPVTYHSSLSDSDPNTWSTDTFGSTLIVYNELGNFNTYYIGAKVTAWSSAAPGTYTATLTFNFEVR